MASLDFRQLDNITHRRVSVGAATLPSVADIVIYVSMFIYISIGGVFAGRTRQWWVAA